MLAFVKLAAAAAALLSEPGPMVVPQGLLTLTSMPEPSGLVWSAQLSRYLVLSDDTGDKQRGTNHAPWLFAMNKQGVMDDAPIPILGLEKLNDAEAICSGPGNSFFLATSHSKNRKGQDKDARHLLLQLAPSGRALKILGTLDILPAIIAAGIVTTGTIDIEGIAFREGALYLGLKAPQNAAGSALILRVRDVMPALPTGLVPSQNVQLWAEVPLQVPGPSGAVVQGISDMSFLPDGSLAILANSPKKKPPDGGGALWWLRSGNPPHLLRRFPGLKPEGVTVTPDGKSLLIVIDHDRQQPLWLHQQLPTLGRLP